RGKDQSPRRRRARPRPHQCRAAARNVGARRGAGHPGMHRGYRKTRRRAAYRMDGPWRARVQRHAGSAQRGWLYPLARLAGRRPADLEPNARRVPLKGWAYPHLLVGPVDAQPIWMQTRAGPLLSVPYPMELNDAGAQAHRDHTGREFGEMIVDQFEEMLEQSQRQPLVYALSLHGFIVGQPFRLRPVRQAIKHCVEHKYKDRVWYTRAGDIAKYCFSLPKGLIPGSAALFDEIESMNFVALDRVSLRYGEDEAGTLALHGTTLQVGLGEFVAVVGPSGCGKSTLM